MTSLAEKTINRPAVRPVERLICPHRSYRTLHFAAASGSNPTRLPDRHIAGPAAPGPHIDTQTADHICKDSHTHIAIDTGATPFPSANRGVRTAADGRAHQRQHPAGAAERPRIPHSIAGGTSTALPARALFICPGRTPSAQRRIISQPTGLKLCSSAKVDSSKIPD